MNASSLEFRRWFMMVFAVCCVGVNLIAFVLYKKNQEITESSEWVNHTYDTITLEYALFSKIQDMHIAQRGFLLTGNESFLKRYHDNYNPVFKDLDDLKKLTSDNAKRQKELVEYKSTITEFFQALDRRIELRKAGRDFLGDELANSRALMNKIRDTHTSIVNSERQLLQIRANDENRKRDNYVNTLFASAIFSVIGLIVANGVVFFLTWRRRLADEELRRMNKEMEGFTYIASHDLRSPLVNLKGFASEMQFGIDELKPLIANAVQTLPENDSKKITRILDEDIGDSLRYVHSAVQKMDKLTNAILELSRIGRRNLNVENVDTARIVRHILDTLHHTITSKDIKVHLSSLPTVIADPLSLEQVFGNVIDNAIKYLEPARPGVLHIGGHKTYRETKFWVRDNGRGISSYDMERIFEIYRRGGGHQDVPGEGMGMAYVRTTLRRLGGTIWCESEQGVGTTFYFTISNNLKKEDQPS